MGLTANFPKASSIAYTGPDPYVTIALTTPSKRYVAVAAYDTFGKTGLNISTEQNTTPLSLEATNWSLVGIKLTVNTPIANRLYWTAGTILQGTLRYNIVAGSVLWTTGTIYLYFNPNISTTTLQTTPTLGIAVLTGCYPIATYTGGDITHLKGGDGSAFISGSSIIAGTIGAAQLIAGNAVITGTAQIANAIITNAHIQDGTIQNAKIGNVIQSTNYNEILKTGWRLNKGGNFKSYGAFTLMNSLGNIMVDLNGIDGNYLKTATIGTAAIKNASITNAKIGNLAVDTLKIAGNAVTVPVSTYHNDRVRGNGAYQDIAHVGLYNSSDTSMHVTGIFTCRLDYLTYTDTSNRATGYKVYKDYTLLIDYGKAGAVNDFPNLSFDDYIPAKSSRFYYILWYGESQVVATTRSLVVIGTKR